MAFGDKLREILEQRELLQVDFAKKMNVSKSSLNSYINNHQLPNIILVRDMAKELGVSVDYLLDYQPAPESVAVSPRDAIFLKKLRALPAEKQELVVSLVQMLSEK